MAVRIRRDGRIFCAAMHPEEPLDIYIDDNLHYQLSVVAKVLVTEHHDRHQTHGQWWWVNDVPPTVVIDEFYFK